MPAQARTNCAHDADRARKTPEARTICLAKKKSSFDLQISSHIDKRMKNLQ